MDPMSAGFLGFMLLGFLWIIWRIGRYIRFHRNREYAWSQFGSEEEFRKFIEDLRNSKAGKNSQVTSPPSPNTSSQQEIENGSGPDQPRD